MFNTHLEVGSKRGKVVWIGGWYQESMSFLQKYHICVILGANTGAVRQAPLTADRWPPRLAARGQRIQKLKQMKGMNGNFDTLRSNIRSIHGMIRLKSYGKFSNTEKYNHPCSLHVG